MHDESAKSRLKSLVGAMRGSDSGRWLSKLFLSSRVFTMCAHMVLLVGRITTQTSLYSSFLYLGGYLIFPLGKTL